MLPFRSSDSRYAGHLVYEAVPNKAMISGRRRFRHLTFLHGEDLLVEDKTEWFPFSFSRIMFLPELYANVPRHLPPHPPPPSSGGPSPPPFLGSPPSSPMSGEEPGLCGLTHSQWHMVLTFGILREWAIHPFPPILSILTRKDLVSYACSAVLVALLIALIISWLNGSEISLLWLQAQDRVKLTRMGAFPPFLFCAHDTDELSLSVTLTSIHPK